VNDERKQELLNELVRLTVLPPRLPDDIMKEDYIEHIKHETGEVIGVTTAHNRLMRLVDAGGWETLMVWDRQASRRRRIWRKKGDDDDDS